MNMNSLDLIASQENISIFSISERFSGEFSLQSPFNNPSSHSRSRALPSLVQIDREFEQKPLIASVQAAKRERIRGKNQRIVGSAENDVLDASKGKGNNTLIGKKGNDRLKGKKEDKLLGGPGNDRLDTRNGRDNILKGGGGNDRFFVGKKDQASGGGGDDTLNALKGKGNNVLKGGSGDDVLIGKMGDRLIGGPGADEFVLVKGKLPNKVLTVQDFQQGSDRLVIQNFPDATVFSDLTVTQQNADTLISIQGKAVAVLKSFTATLLTSDDIDGIAPTPTPTLTPTLTLSPIQLSVANDEVFEGNPGDDTQVTFIVSLSRPADQDITVTYKTVSVLNEATPDIDYISIIQGTLTIPKGASARPIDIPIIEDLDDEENERVDLEIISATGAEIVDGKAMGLIKDDEDESIKTEKGNQYSLIGFDIDDNPFFDVGTIKTYTKTRTDGNDVSADLESIVIANFIEPGALNEFGDPEFIFISDDRSNVGEENIGVFELAIRSYSNIEMGISLDNADLTATLDGTTVTYIIDKPFDGIAPITKTLDLASNPSLDSGQAVNNLLYIIENDLIKLAFFP